LYGKELVLAIEDAEKKKTQGKKISLRREERGGYLLATTEKKK